MPRCIRVALSLFLLAIPLLAADGQSCTEQMRHAAAHQAARIVSAADLRIPAKAWQHFEKARTASENNQSKLVQREVGQAVAIAPQFAEAYLLLAAQQVRDHQYDLALQTISTARNIQSNVPWSSVVVASALNQLGRFHEAAAELDRVQAEESGTWQAKFEHARAEIGRHDAEAALRWSELAVEAAPVGCTDARLLRSNAFQLAGRPADAVRELETYLELDRQDTSRTAVIAALARLRSASEQEDRALLAER